MDVYLSPEQRKLRGEVRAFLDASYPPERILPMEEDEEYPEEFYRECAKGGWTGIPVPREYGGSDGSVLDLCVFVEEVGKTSISLSTLYITGTIFGSHALHICGSPEQRERYLPAIVTGDKRFALAMSEPGAGSDFAGMQTRAERVDGGWRIDGLKGPISGAERAEVIITAARTSSHPGEAQAEVAAARLLVYAAAHKRDVEGPCPMEASMAKMLANNVAARATSAALQAAGARGYERDSHFMRRYLEVRGCELGGGTSQIQRNIIARFMGMG